MQVRTSSQIHDHLKREKVVDFLASITPSKGVLFLVTPINNGEMQRGCRHIGCDNASNLADSCLEASVEGQQVYYAMSSYKSKSYYCEKDQRQKSRTKDNVAYVRSMWIDIDCGEAKPYESQKLAQIALDDWRAKNDLPEPTYVVSSGNGLHVYWTFFDDLTIEEWQPIANIFARLQKQGRLKSDPLSANAACILRPIGTYNYKDPHNPKRVTLLSAGPVYEFGEWSALINRIDSGNNRKVSVARKSRSPLIDALLCTDEEYPPSDPQLMADKCQFFDAMRKTVGAEQSEPEWFSALGVLSKCVNGDSVAQLWSSGHSGYSFEGTRKKLQQWKGVGPTTCERIRLQSAACIGCKQTCKSPIQLGHPIAKVASDYQIAISKEKFAELFEMPVGDILAARYFAYLNEGKNIFVPQHGMWFQWDGYYWKQDNHGGMEVAKKTSDQFLKHTSDLLKTDPERYKPYINFAYQLRNKGRLDSMLALAASEPSISVAASLLDKNTFLFGVPNGVVDLRHAKLLPPSPDNYISKQAGYAFNENAQCPNWLEFLNAVFQSNQSIIKFIQVALGYTLTGSNTEELIFILYGNGANGKSVFGNLVAKILGSYGIAGDSSVLVSQKPDMGPSSEMARYAGKRYVSFNETAAGNKLDARAVKVLAGREPIVARHLYQKAFEFTPQFTPWLRTNHKPIVTDTDDGIWRRLVLIPCKAVFAGSNNDPNIESRLLSEGEGILRWIVEGAKIWYQGGLQIPLIIANEVKIYRSDSDLFGEFLSDNIKRVTGGRTEQSLVWSRYTMWCHSENIHSGTKASFTRRLAECGYPSVKSNGRRYYQGVELLQGA